MISSGNLDTYWWEHMTGKHRRGSVKECQQVPVPIVSWAEAPHSPKKAEVWRSTGSPDCVWTGQLRGTRLELLESDWGEGRASEALNACSSGRNDFVLSIAALRVAIKCVVVAAVFLGLRIRGSENALTSKKYGFNHQSYIECASLRRAHTTLYWTILFMHLFPPLDCDLFEDEGPCVIILCK